MQEEQVLYWQASCYASEDGFLATRLTVWRGTKVAYSERFYWSDRATPMDAAAFVEKAVRIIEMAPVLYPSEDDYTHEQVARLVR